MIEGERIPLHMIYYQVSLCLIIYIFIRNEEVKSMWLLLAFLSAALLGFYDAFKKHQLKGNHNIGRDA